MSIQAYLNNFHTLEDLVPIAERLTARLSFWGSNYVVIKPGADDLFFNLNASAAPIDALLDRVIKVLHESRRGIILHSETIKNFTYAEHEACRRLEKVMDRLCLEDDQNFKRSNIITKIFAIIRGCFQDNFRYRWYDFKWGCDGQILRRRPYFTVWDNKIHEYVPRTEDNAELWK